MSFCSPSLVAEHFDGQCCMECGFGAVFLSQRTVSLWKHTENEAFVILLGHGVIGTDSGTKLCYFVPMEEDIGTAHTLLLGVK